MKQAKILTEEEYAAALAAPLTLRQEGEDKLYLPSLEAGNHRPCYDHVLEQTLLAVFGEQNLYRSGMTIHTTLDRSLLIELGRAMRSAQPDFGAGIPEEVLVVMQGGKIRAFVCRTDREQEVHDFLASHWFKYIAYDVARISPRLISREQFIRSDDDKAK